MKKFIISALFLGLFSVPISTHALIPRPPQTLTCADITAISTILNLTPTQVQAISTLVPGGCGGSIIIDPLPPTCFNFANDFGFGSLSADINSLGMLLVREGFSLQGRRGPSFDNVMREAVVKFQAKYGIKQTGYVGPITRAKLNSLYGCKKDLKISILAPNGGEVWQKGTTQTIRWFSGLAYIPESVGGVNIKLLPLPPTCLPVNQPCPAVVMSQYSIVENVADSGVLSWTIEGVNPGAYKIRICSTSSPNYCGESRDYFTVIAGATDQSGITVTSPNGGETWVANSAQDIKWAISYNATCSLPFNSLCGDPLPPKSPTVDLYLDPYIGCDDDHVACPAIYVQPHVLDKNISGGYKGVYGWIVATDIADKPIPAGQYLMRICPAGSLIGCDSSARPFTITR